MLGCGNIGSVVARDLAESLPSTEIIVADMNRSRLEEVVSKMGRANVSWVQADASNHRQLVSVLKKSDITVGTLPGSMGFQACKASIAAQVDMVDVSYMPEDVMTLNKSALKADVCLVPDCRMSPGLGNILVGHAVSRLDRVEGVYMINGGLPGKPVPPLGYVITWSVRDLIDIVAMLVKVNGVRKGRKVAYTYCLLDRFDKKRMITAMARCTAFTASVVAQLQTMKAVDEKGVVPPEKLGMSERVKVLVRREVVTCA